ncbi:hypothetical protein GGR56DRAFT_679083 [Xylariaceae sp. FL0804]|nr:hypothetical protein GGR56DRAFT_679083 [Xylariaceae sp. FL0804]
MDELAELADMLSAPATILPLFDQLTPSSMSFTLDDARLIDQHAQLNDSVINTFIEACVEPATPCALGIALWPTTRFSSARIPNGQIIHRTLSPRLIRWEQQPAQDEEQPEAQEIRDNTPPPRYVATIQQKDDHWMTAGLMRKANPNVTWVDGFLMVADSCRQQNRAGCGPIACMLLALFTAGPDDFWAKKAARAHFDFLPQQAWSLLWRRLDAHLKLRAISAQMLRYQAKAARCDFVRMGSLVNKRNAEQAGGNDDNNDNNNDDNNGASHQPRTKLTGPLVQRKRRFRDEIDAVERKARHEKAEGGLRQAMALLDMSVEVAMATADIPEIL